MSAILLALLLPLPLPLRAQRASITKAEPSRHSDTDNGIAAINTQLETALAGGNDAKAFHILETGLRAHPDWKEGWWHLGSIRYEGDEYESARDAFAELAQLDPQAGAAWVMVGLCDFQLHDFGLALRHIEKGRALGFPKNPELSDVARYHEGAILLFFGQYEQSAVILDSFARELHRSDYVVLALGLAALHIRVLVPDAPEVLDAERVAVARQVGEAEYLGGQRKYAEARQIFDQLLTQHEHLRYLHYAAAVLLERAGEITSAKDLLKQELRLNPSSVPARLELASLAFNDGAVNVGMPLAKEAVVMEPKSFAAHYMLGKFLIASGKTDEGVRELEISRDLNPDSSGVRYLLAQGYFKLHRREDALREQKAFARLKPIEDSLLHSGKLPISVFQPPQRVVSK